jgi:glycosyltransferase involved in cell wall biosynthesis
MNSTEDLTVDSFASESVPLRIAIVTETFPPEVNGVAMTLGRIVEGMLERGNSLQVVRPRQRRDATHQLREGLDEVLSRGVPLPAYGDLQFGMPSRGRLIKLWSEQRPDVVHVVTEGPLGWSAVAAARKLQLPITSSYHTNFQRYSPHYGVGLLKAPIEAYLRKLHNKTMATMVPTKAMMQELQQRGYENVTLLSRGVATEQFNPSRRSMALRESWGAGPQDLVVELVGRLAKEKNVGLVLSAFRAIRARAPNAKLVLVGDGPLRKSLEESVPEAHFAGTRQGNDLASHYASGDLFLFPSLTETFGNVVPEAMASGLAVVSYDIAAAKELIESGFSGVLVPPGDELAFVNAAVELATNLSKRTQIQGVAAQSVCHLAWGAVHDSFLSTLTRAVQMNSRVFAVVANTTRQSGELGKVQQRLAHSDLHTLL